MNNIFRTFAWIFGSNIAAFIVLILGVPIIILLAVGAIFGTILGPIFELLKFLGIIDVPDIPANVVNQVNQQTEQTVGTLKIPIKYIPVYQTASIHYQVPWALPAAIHKAGSDFGHNLGTGGHMNLKETIWAGESWEHNDAGEITEDIDIQDPANIQTGNGYGVDADEDGKANPSDAADGIFTAASFSAANGVIHGASEETIKQALLKLNQDPTYVQTVWNYYLQLLNDPTLGDLAGLPTGIPALAPVDALGWPAPSNFTITSGFGYRIHPITGENKAHQGIDIAGLGIEGQPAYATMDATVSFAGQQGGYGNTVILDVGKGTTILYAHLQSVLVTPGQIVKKGEPIGLIGTTGMSTGPHLHFEVRVGGVPVNPIPYLTKSTNPS